jgi:precorrin-2 dehydrogenase / sirohydrochlorin ferrochelatase
MVEFLHKIPYMKYYPIFLDIRGKCCLVIGGGEVAERKVESLLQAGGQVTVISPNLTPGLARLAAAGEIIYHQRKYKLGDLTGSFLTYAATNNEEVHQRIAAEAAKQRGLLNVADHPALCTFIVPSIVSQGDLTLAVSTGGASPALARHIGQTLRETFGPEYNQALQILARIREKLRPTALSAEERQQIFTTLVESPLLDHLHAKRQTEINTLLRQVVGEDFTLEQLGIVL